MSDAVKDAIWSMPTNATMANRAGVTANQCQLDAQFVNNLRFVGAYLDMQD